MHELIRPSTPFTALPRHLRALAERIKGIGDGCPTPASTSSVNLPAIVTTWKSWWRHSNRAETVPIPEWYKYFAVVAYERGAIGDCDLAFYMRCDIVRAREIAALTLRGRDVDRLAHDTSEAKAFRVPIECLSTAIATNADDPRASGDAVHTTLPRPRLRARVSQQWILHDAAAASSWAESPDATANQGATPAHRRTRTLILLVGRGSVRAGCGGHP